MKYITEFLKAINKILNSLLEKALFVNDFERYIQGHNPKSHSQIDNLIKNYERKRSASWKL